MNFISSPDIPGQIEKRIMREQSILIPNRVQRGKLYFQAQPLKVWQRSPVLALCALLYALLMPAFLLGAEVSVVAELNVRHIPLDQAALLTVTVQGSNSARLEEPSGDGLQFMYKGQNSQMQWINGKASSSVAYVYMVEADQPGEHTIEPITVRINAKQYTTEPITFTVLPVATPTVPPSNKQGGKSVQPPSSTRLRSEEGGKIGFMRIIPEKKTIYSGERLSFTIKALFRQGIRASIKSNPRLTDGNFIVEHLDDKPKQSEEVIEGIPYTLVSWQGTLSAIKQGVFPMEVEMDAKLLVKAKRQRPSSRFGSSMFNDPFFDDFFSGFSQKDITLISPKQSIEVLDLPEKGKPTNFSGAIGTFSLAVNAQPKTIQPGDPITLKMMIQGTGNFDRVKAPAFPENNNWKTYPPSSATDDSTTIGTKKEFEQAIVPVHQQVSEIPPLHFSYFDPKLKSYITLSSDPISITLLGTAQTAGQQNTPQQQERLQEKVNLEHPVTDSLMLPIHTELGTTIRSLLPLYQRGWFQVILAFSLFFLLLATLLLWRSHTYNGDPSRRERQVLLKELQGERTQAQLARENNDSREFIALCRRILQKRFGHMWRLEPQALSAADFDRQLGKDSDIATIFRKTENTAYTGETMTPQEMEQVLENIDKEISKI